MTITIPTPEALPAAAAQFVESMGSHHVFAFIAPMGAGKTTFIRAVCEALGVTDVVTSPTFAIVNEYVAAASQRKVYHFDLYRLTSTEEALNIGIEDYLYSGSPCFVEWPEVAANLLPDDTLYVRIEVQHDGSRVITTEPAASATR